MADQSIPEQPRHTEPHIGRRGFLTGAASLSVGAAALPAILTPLERVHAADAELRAALLAYDPNIVEWIGPGITDDTFGKCRYILTAAVSGA